jgi:hypothetical protein
MRSRRDFGRRSFPELRIPDLGGGEGIQLGSDVRPGPAALSSLPTLKIKRVTAHPLASPLVARFAFSQGRRPMLEYDCSNHPFRMVLVSQPTLCERDVVDVPSGIGVEVDRGVLGQYRVA